MVLHKKSRNKTAVLILNYNGKRFLETCLDSVLAQTFKGFKVFLIDNGSADGSVEFVQAKYPQVDIIANQTNLGFTLAYNIGFLKTLNCYEYIVLLNNDVRLHKDWLRELLKPFEIDERIAISTSAILSWDGKYIDHMGGHIINLVAGVFGGYKGGTRASHDEIGFFDVFYGSGCSFAIKSTILKDVGIFDPYFLFYYEDVDLSWRCLLKGCRVVCNPRSAVFHFGSGTVGTKPVFEFHKEKNLLAIMFRNLGNRYLILLLIPLLLARFLISLTRLRVSKKVFYARIAGIIHFLKNLPYHISKRRVVQRTRRCSDSVVFRSNPTPIVSFKGL